MLISNPDLINSCRVCRSPNQDGDYEYLYESAAIPELSHAGKLYEELLGEVSPETYDYYPRYLCNSCDLQLKLFKKLKDKAIKTMAFLSQLYGEQLTAVKDEQPINLNANQFLVQVGHVQALELEQEQLNEVATNDEQPINTNVDDDTICSSDIAYRFEDIESIIDPTRNSENNSHYIENKCTQDEQNLQSVEQRLQQMAQEVTQTDQEHCANIEDHLEHDNLGAAAIHYPLEIAVPENNQNVLADQQLRSPIDKSDYVLEIYELLEDGTKAVHSEHLVEGDEEAEDADITDFDIEEENESQLDYNDEQYIDYEAFSPESNAHEAKTPRQRRATKRKAPDDGKKREYKCTECGEIFTNTKDFKFHRENIHAQVYSCSICSKTFKSPYSLPTHMKIHDTPAFQCELCERTFTQKIHYQYHMNRHNNIRNFKCDECGKGFIGKTDLKIHMRQHTGDRPYVCDICGKDYMLSEHLKSHALKHTGQQFPCELCQQKFATPKTLRQHMQTIHADEPKFKCTYCLKPFRRKHHLQYHMKQLHPSMDIITESLYDVIDDPHEVNKSEAEEDDDITVGGDDDLVEQDGYMHDPGYEALSDDTMLM